MDNQITKALEQQYIGELLKSAAGLWLLRRLVRQSGVFQPMVADPAYIGANNLIWREVVHKVMEHFGSDGCQLLLKELCNGERRTDFI